MATVTGYQFYNDGVLIQLSNGRTLSVWFNSDSGKVYYRDKIGSPTGVKHTGIYIGGAEDGTEVWIHNHYHVGKACIASGESFRQNKPVFLYNEFCINEWRVVIEKGLQHVLNGERYKPFSFNCQTMTNSSCNNKRTSEDGARIARGIVGGIFAGLLFGAGVGVITALVAGSKRA